MRELKRQIDSGTLGNLYLFYGEERYLINMYVQNVCRALLSEEDEMMNLSVMDEPKSVSDIVSTLETLPFMAERRLVILKNTGAFVPGDDWTELAKAVEGLTDTVAVFVETEVNKTSKMYKTVDRCGRAVEFARQPDNDLIRWISREAQKDGKELPANVAAYFLAFVGNDMTNMLTQWMKLRSYLCERTAVTREDVEAVCTPDVNDKVFDIVNAIAAKKAGAALTVYNEMLSRSTKPQQVLAMIINQFRSMLRAVILTKEGKSVSEVAEELGVRSGRASYLVSEARSFGEARLRAILADLLETDAASKNGNIDANDACMLIIMRYTE